MSVNSSKIPLTGLADVLILMTTVDIIFGKTKQKSPDHVINLCRIDVFFQFFKNIFVLVLRYSLDI